VDLYFHFPLHLYDVVLNLCMGTGSEASLVASKETSIDVKTEKTVIFMSHE
jgi:hypothetical protein